MGYGNGKDPAGFCYTSEVWGCQKLLLILFQGLEHFQRRFMVSVKDLLLGATDDVFKGLLWA